MAKEEQKPIGKIEPVKKAVPKDDQGKEKSFNNKEDWDKAQESWMKAQGSRIQAHANRFFTTDEDLPLSRHILLFSIAAFFFIFVLWANFAKLDEVTRGDGRVIPSSEVQKLSSLEGGIVDEFFVKEGEEVRAGQTLVRLRDIEASSDLDSNNVRYLGLLAAVTRLQAEVEGEVPEFPDEVMQGAPQSVTEELNTFRANREKMQGQISILEQQLSQRQQELRELQTRANDLREVIRLSREEKSMIEPLVERGSAPRVELIQLERALKERQSELNSVLTSVPRARSAIEEAQARIDEIKTTARAESQTELSAKMVEMNAIKESLGALQDRKTRTEIKSPVNGFVKDFKVNTVGGVVKPGEDFIEIVPKDDQLLVEVQIRPSDIAFLYPEQPAVVKITAYDFSIYGGLDGRLVDISPDAIINEKGESFYRVRVQTYENALKRKGEILPIIPGMVASVDILTGEKTVMEYLLKPFVKTLDKAMNER